MHKFIATCLVTVIALPTWADATSQASASAVTASEATKSRIRIFGQNGATARIFPASTCVKPFWGSGGIVVSGGMGQAFASFVGAASNISLGMPETQTSLNLHNRDGILSKAYYQEHEITANQPASLALGYQDVSSFYVSNGVTFGSVSPSCGGSITFTPQAGMDYEASFNWSGRKCSIGVNQIITTDGKAELIPVAVTAAPAC